MIFIMKKEEEKRNDVLMYVITFVVSALGMVSFFMIGKGNWFGGSDLAMVLAGMVAAGSVFISVFFMFLFGCLNDLIRYMINLVKKCF